MTATMIQPSQEERSFDTLMTTCCQYKCLWQISASTRKKTPLCISCRKEVKVVQKYKYITVPERTVYHVGFFTLKKTIIAAYKKREYYLALSPKRA